MAGLGEVHLVQCPCGSERHKPLGTQGKKSTIKAQIFKAVTAVTSAPPTSYFYSAQPGVTELCDLSTV